MWESIWGWTLQTYQKIIALNPALETVMVLSLGLICSFIPFFIFRLTAVKAIEKAAAKTKMKLDDDLVRYGFFNRLSWLIIPLGLYIFTFFVDNDGFRIFSQKTIQILMIFSLSRILSALISASTDNFQKTDKFKDVSVKGLAQAMKLLVYLLSGIFIVALILGKSPWGIISGIGAVSAVLLLMFKDTILSFVAGLQISLTKKMKPGDWVELPQYGADGTVIDISLNTVKIQNFDKTIVSIPTYKFIEEPFKNWAGMQESGGRRIKRNIAINQESIRFCTADMLEHFKKVSVLKDYIAVKEKEIDEHNQSLGDEGKKHPINVRNQTNIGIFRNYLEYYLKSRKDIHQQGMTLMVRQLPPGPNGLPLQIYCFTKTTDWVAYEKIQADIFDHILSVVGLFGLKIFQEPTGWDFRTTEQ